MARTTARKFGLVPHVALAGTGIPRFGAPPNLQPGEWVEVRSTAVNLDDVTASGDPNVGRWYCPRALFPYWREDWL